MNKKNLIFSAVFFTCLMASNRSAQAGVGSDAGLILSGVARIVGAAVSIPATMLASSTTAFPFGLIMGAVGGTMNAVGGLLGGAFSIAQGAAPYAKYAAFL